MCVDFDAYRTFEEHASSFVKAYHFHISNIGRNRNFINIKTLCNAFVTSKLDYANSLVFGINKITLDRIQKVQNTASRLVLRTTT